MVKVFIETYGCASNQADSEIITGLLKQNEFELVETLEKSDLNIINTCIVKTPTEQRMIFRIRELSKLNKPLIVAGCMPKTERRIIEKINPNTSMIGPDSIQKIVDVAYETLKGKKVVFLEDLRKPKLCLPRIRKNSIINIIPISIGCLANCSYCGVKFARGKLFSYPVELILKEVKQAVNNGCKELYVTSQDNGCYGKDIDTNLAELLKEICKIEGKFFVRVGMMNPVHVKDIIDELIEIYKNEKIFKFLHLPTQSFSERILKLMKRGYKPETVLKIIKKFYAASPDLTFSTDVIVGFPSENDLDFEETVKFIEKIKPDIVNISKFGPRPETEAAKMKQLPVKIVNKRSKQLHELVKAISLEKNQRWIDWEGEVLIDEKGREDTWMGRNFAYKPIVVKSGENLFGKFVNVKIVEAKSNYLIGNI